MTIEDVKAIIQGDETRTLEMKKTTGELKEGMRSACAHLDAPSYWDVPYTYDNRICELRAQR